MTMPFPSRYSSSGLYSRLKPPSTIEVKSPIAGFSISTVATAPRFPQRQTRGTRRPLRTIAGAPLNLSESSYCRLGATSVDSPCQSRNRSESRPARIGWSGTRGKTLRRPYSCTRKPKRFSSTSADCSKTITLRPSRTRVRSRPGPFSVSAFLPMTRVENAVRSDPAVTVAPVIPREARSLVVSPEGSNTASLGGAATAGRVGRTSILK